MPRFELAASNKFWEITLKGAVHTTKFGKIGSPGQTKLKEFTTPFAAKAMYEELIKRKTQLEGYTEIKAAKGKAAKGKAAATAPTVKAASDAKLEAAIIADPDDADAYLVYADWLQAQGDPRGELIVLQHGNKKAAAKKLLDKYPEHFYGPLAAQRFLLDGGSYDREGTQTTWRWGYLQSLWIGNTPDDGNLERDDIDIADSLEQFLAHPSCRFLRELTVGIPEFTGTDYTGITTAIAKRPRPTIASLYLGDFIYEETELNWSEIGPIKDLPKALPNLTKLVLRSKPEFGKKPLDFGKLEELTLITGSMDKDSLKAIVTSKWPALRKLALPLGQDDSFKQKDIQNVLDGTGFPKLEHLSLGNSDNGDALCTWLVGSKLAAKLKVLDLSEGTIGSAGAKALAAGKFPQLEQLNLAENWIPKADHKALKKLAAKVDLSDQRNDDDDVDADPGDRYIAGYE